MRPSGAVINNCLVFCEPNQKAVVIQQKHREDLTAQEFWERLRLDAKYTIFFEKRDGCLRLITGSLVHYGTTSRGNKMLTLRTITIEHDNHERVEYRNILLHSILGVADYDRDSVYEVFT